MGNPISAALDELTVELQAAVGSAVLVTRDPAAVGPRVASSGVAVLIGPGVVTEPSSYRTWFLDVPVHVMFDAPADPRHLDPAYEVAGLILDAEKVVRSMEAGTVTLDAATSLPAVTVNVQITTEC